MAQSDLLAFRLQVGPLWVGIVTDSVDIGSVGKFDLLPSHPASARTGVRTAGILLLIGLAIPHVIELAVDMFARAAICRAHRFAAHLPYG